MNTLNCTNIAELMSIVQRTQETTNDRLLRLPQVKAKIGYATSTIWKCVKEGTLHAPISLGPRSVAWRESELQAWIDANTYASRTKRRIDMKQFIALLTAI
jgi:prophage regulatory protein